VCAKPRPVRYLRHQGGATALEFAMVLPIFIAFMIGIFEFGWAQHKLSTIRFAMETAARQLMLNPTLTEAQISTLVKNKINGIGDSNVTITLTMVDTVGGKVAKMTGVYASDIGIPQVASFPLNWTTTVSTVMPTP